MDYYYSRYLSHPIIECNKTYKYQEESHKKDNQKSEDQEEYNKHSIDNKILEDQQLQKKLELIDSIKNTSSEDKLNKDNYKLNMPDKELSDKSIYQSNKDLWMPKEDQELSDNNKQIGKELFY